MTPGPTLLVVAPSPGELRGLLRRARPVRRLARRPPTWSLRLGGTELLAAVTGEGQASATERLSALLERWRPERLLTIGVAGGLSPELAVGQVVAASSVDSEAGAAPLPDSEWTAAAGVLGALVYSSPRIAGRAAQKSALRSCLGGDGVAVVDLESAAYARVAAAAGVPYACLRAVSDAADEDLPVDFERFRRGSGELDRGAVVRHALRHPSLLTALVDLRRRLLLCSRHLGVAVESMV